MSKNNNADMPAMPCDDIVLRDNNGGLNGYPVAGSGLTKREKFCLAMGVAETGDDELDAIIKKGNRQKKIAAMAMQGLLSNSVMGDSELHENPADWVKDITGSSVEFADALLSQLEQEKDK